MGKNNQRSQKTPPKKKNCGCKSKQQQRSHTRKNTPVKQKTNTLKKQGKLSKSQSSKNKKKTKQTKAEQLIHKSNVVIFSKSYCPYCSKAKKLLQTLSDSKINILELDLEPNGTKIQDELFRKTNQKTVPNIFIKKKHIGGYDDILKLGNKKLKTLINSS